MPVLVGVDVDRTLCYLNSSDFYPEAVALIEAYVRAGCRIAVISNQGAPALRDAGIEWAANFPTYQDVLARFAKIKAQLEVITEGVEVPVYICWGYYLEEEKRWIIPKDLPEDEILNPEQWEVYRKPGPGMLRRAAIEVETTAPLCTYLGDEVKDGQAAKAAGWKFMLCTWGHAEAINA